MCIADHLYLHLSKVIHVLSLSPGYLQQVAISLEIVTVLCQEACRWYLCYRPKVNECQGCQWVAEKLKAKACQVTDSSSTKCHPPIPRDCPPRSAIFSDESMKGPSLPFFLNLGVLHSLFLSPRLPLRGCFQLITSVINLISLIPWAGSKWEPSKQGNRAFLHRIGIYDPSYSNTMRSNNQTDQSFPIRSYNFLR